MDVIQRGNPGIMRSIQQKAKQISESNGMASVGSIANAKPPEMAPQGGAYATMMKAKESSTPSSAPSRDRISVNERISSPNPDRRLMDRLLESVETLSYSKEYFNATSSLLTLYAMGKLTEGVLNTLSREDLREIKGIIREFKETLDNC